MIPLNTPAEMGFHEHDLLDFRPKSKLPPGPTLSPAQQKLEWFLRPYEFLSRCASEFREAFTLRLVDQGEYVVFSSPAANKQIFAFDASDLSAGEGNMLIQGVMGPRSMFAIDGADHLNQRRTVVPSFSRNAVNASEDLMREETLRIVDLWKTGQPFPVTDQLTEIALNTILRLIFGNSTSSHVAQMKAHVKGLMAIIGTGAVINETDEAINPFDPRVRFRQLRHEFDRLIQTEIETRAHHKERTYGDLFSTLLEAEARSEGRSHPTEIADQVLTLLVAGHETTATSVSWALHWIHRTPGVLDRLLAELESNGWSCGPENTYLDAVCQETLRISPVVPIVARVVKKPLEIQGIPLDPGTVVCSAIYLTHHRDDLYERPETFDPERFLKRKYGPHEFVAFGGGVRRCAGMNFAFGHLKLMLVTLLSRFSFRIASKRPVKPVRRSLTIGPSEGLPVIVSPRDQGGARPQMTQAHSKFGVCPHLAAAMSS